MSYPTAQVCGDCGSLMPFDSICDCHNAPRPDQDFYNPYSAPTTPYVGTRRNPAAADWTYLTQPNPSTSQGSPVRQPGPPHPGTPGPQQFSTHVQPSPYQWEMYSILAAQAAAGSSGWPQQYYPHPSQLQHPQQPPVLEDSTSTVVNANGKRPSATAGGGKAKKKRKARPAPPPPDPADFPLSGAGGPSGSSVGPSSAAPDAAPTRTRPSLHFGSITAPTRTPSSEMDASDVYYFVFHLQGKTRPASIPLDQPRIKSRRGLNTLGHDHVACRLCLPAAWNAWNIKNGQTDTIRDHLRTHHFDQWRETVIEQRLKGWEKLGFKTGGIPVAPSPGIPQEPFTRQGLERRIAHMVTHADLAINFVENPFFRELLTYVSSSPRVLQDKDILHRTRVHDVIVLEYEKEMNSLREELQHALGRISFTTDLWSCMLLRSFMAVTLHYCAEDGKNLVIGCITLDNATNCDTMMAELETLLKQEGIDLEIEFDHDGNRIRCFPHIVNISVKHGLKALTKSTADGARVPDPDAASDLEPSTSAPSELPPEAATSSTALPPDYDLELPDLDPDEVAAQNVELQRDKEYCEALKRDPIKRCRDLVKVIRVSGHRREELRDIILEGNLTTAFGEGRILRAVRLLCDVDTRWSSTFIMIDRVLELHPALEIMLDLPHYDKIKKHLLDPAELRVLNDIRNFLSIPHRVQQLLSSEQTPTAPIVLPVYEKLADYLEKAKKSYPKIKHAIDASLASIKKYMCYTRRTRVYALAMTVNPACRFQWLRQHWAPEESEAAREWLVEAMMKHRAAMRTETSPRGNPSPGASGGAPCQPLSRTASAPSVLQHGDLSHPNARAAAAQRGGLNLLDALDLEFAELDNASSDSAETQSASQTTSNRASGEAVLETDEEREARLLAEDRAAVEAEIAKYEKMPPFSGNICDFWQANRHELPIMFRVAVDLLPAQASATASERVFSSSKETTTLRRSGLDGAMLEVLQILKYSLKQRLRERGHRQCIAREEELLGPELVTPEEAAGLLQPDKLPQLLQHIHEALGDE